jgi:RND superfamily putative drug exporter
MSKLTGRRKKLETQNTPGRKMLWLAIAVIIGWLGISGAAGPLFGKLSSVQQNDSAGFLPESAESTRAAELASGFTTQDQTVLPALVLWTGDVTPEAMAKFATFPETLKSVPVPDSDKTVGDYLAADAQLVPIPSPDGKAILMSVPLSDASIAAPLENDKPALPAIIEAMRTHASEIAGFESHVTGIGGIIADLFDSFGSLDSTLILITLLVVGIILIFVYRSPILWLIPLLSAMIALTIAGAVVYLLAKEELISLDGQSQGILSVLVLGAGTDYALLLIARYREELHHYESRFTAMKTALRGVVEPIVASGFTVIAGLLVLSLSDLKSVRSLGPVSAIGVLAAQVVMLTLLPAILVALGRWIFWPRVPRHDDVDEKLTGVWSKVANLVGSRPRRTWVISGALLVVAAAFTTQLQAGGISQTDSFAGRPDSVVGLEKLSEHFPAGSGDPTLVIAPQSDLEATIAALQDVAGVAEINQTLSGPAIPGAPAPEPLVVDGLVQLEVTLTNAADSLAAQETIPLIRNAVHAVNADIVVGGSTATNYDIQQTNIRDRNVIIPVALFVIGLILALLLRSVVAPLFLIVTTVLSFAATLGISHLVFTYLFDYPATDGSFPLFSFVFLVALGIDYNIFLMTRVREESIKLGTRAGILKGLTVTGGVITSAGVVLAATFAVLGTLPLVFLVQLGFAVAFGVLLDTIVVRSLLVPATAYEMGSKIWWPSKLVESTKD